MQTDEAEKLVQALENFALLFDNALSLTHTMSNEDEAKAARSVFFEMMRCSYDLEELILSQHPQFRARIRLSE